MCWVVSTTGSRIKPCLYFFTFETSVAWYSGLQLWCIIPIPPHSCRISKWINNTWFCTNEMRTYSNRYSHFWFSNCVHRGRYKWGLEGDFLCQCWRQILCDKVVINGTFNGKITRIYNAYHFFSSKVNEPRKNNEVTENITGQIATMRQ